MNSSSRPTFFFVAIAVGLITLSAARDPWLVNVPLTAHAIVSTLATVVGISALAVIVVSVLAEPRTWLRDSTPWLVVVLAASMVSSPNWGSALALGAVIVWAIHRGDTRPPNPFEGSPRESESPSSRD